MNELPTLNDLKALLRQGHTTVDYIRLMKRLYPLVVSKTPEQWVLTRYPAGYTVVNGKVLDAQNNEVADVSKELEEWAHAIASVVAWRVVAAVLENEAQCRDQDNQSVLKRHHFHSIERFLDWDKRGPL